MTAGTAFDFDFQHYVASRRAMVEERLAQLLQAGHPQSLFESMRYSALGGGKRLRALLCLSAAEAIAGSPAKTEADLLPARALPECAPDPLAMALPCACAIEMIHAMSLVHDDLPCMDNDDFRRGRPTNHKVFGEAMALLSGDALLVLAFQTLVKETPPQIEPLRLLRLVGELSLAAGASGLVGGQVDDLIATGQLSAENTGKSKADQNGRPFAELLESIHQRKTGALLRFSIWSGACLMGADESTLILLGRFGEVLGLAFQIADDLLDVTGDITSLGKTPGKDQAAGKLTSVAIYGIDQSREILRGLEAEGKQLLRQTGLAERSIAPLVCLLEYAIHRMN